MSAPRITKLVCPSCKGSGCFLTEKFACNWCKGARRVPVKTALDYADVTYVLAGGGYIAGDYSLADVRRLEEEARRIYSLAGRKPRWDTTRRPVVKGEAA